MAKTFLNTLVSFVILFCMTIMNKKNKWVLEQVKPEISLEANVAKLKLSSCRHILRRQGSLEKTVTLGKEKAAGKEEGQPGKGRTP